MPSDPKTEMPAVLALRRHDGHQTVDQVGQSSGRGNRGEEAQHQKNSDDDLAARAQVGQQARVLVAGVGQRALETIDPAAAPPAECLCKP